MQQDQPPPSQTPEASAATELTEEQKQLKAQKHSSGRGLIVPNKTQMVREVAVSPHHTLQLRHGDITKEDTIAIVTPTNETLYHTQGIAGTISRAAGRKVKKECDERVQLKGKVPITQVVISGNGNLPCKYILHAHPRFGKMEKRMRATTSFTWLRYETFLSLPKAKIWRASQYRHCAH